MHSITLKRTKQETYFYDETCSNNLFTLANFLINDISGFLWMYEEYFKNKKDKIDCGGNRTWIKENDKSITISTLYVEEEEYTTTKKKFFKILEQWEKVVAKRPKKILIQEVDGEILIGPLEDDMN